MIARGTCRLCGKMVRALDAQKHERTCLRAIRAAGREVCIPCATVFATPVLATRHALAAHRAADVAYVREAPTVPQPIPWWRRLMQMVKLP